MFDFDVHEDDNKNRPKLMIDGNHFLCYEMIPKIRRKNVYLLCYKIHKLWWQMIQKNDEWWNKKKWEKYGKTMNEPKLRKD